MGAVAVAAASAQDARVVQSDASGIVVEYIPAFHGDDTLAAGGRTATRPSFAGAIATLDAPPGSPEYLIRSILVRFAGAKGNSAQILKTEYTDAANVLLAPVAAYAKGEIDPLAVRTANPSLYNDASFQPAEIARVEHVGETRGKFLGELNIVPYQYNAATKTLRKFSRVLVRVNFGPADFPRLTRPPRGGDAAVAINDRQSAPSGTPLRKTAMVNSVLASGTWYRCTVTDEGMYKITGQTLLGIGMPASTDPRTIRIFNNGGIEPPMAVAAPVIDDLRENAVYLSDGGTPGRLDAQDYIVFYGRSTRYWSYDSASKSYSHHINHYAEPNVYWITSGGAPARAMATIGNPGDPAPYRSSTVLSRIFREDDRINILSSGIEWVGQPFNPGDQITYVHPLPGIDYTQQIAYKFLIGADSPAPSVFTVQEHGATIGARGLAATYTDGNNYFYYSQFVSSLLKTNQVPPFRDGESQLRFLYSTSASQGTGYIDWYELFYRRFTAAKNDLFSFPTVDSTVNAEYAVSGFSGGNVLVFDVTDFDSAAVITGTSIAADTCTFQVPVRLGSPREIYAVGPGGFKSVSGLSPAGNQNLHGTDAGARYLIITHGDFLSAAQRLAAYRALPQGGGFSTAVVDVNQIYNEFGGGLLAPTAIRNYLKYVSSSWSTPPEYVVLFGDGDYDYKRIIGSGPNWIPPWETAESFIPISTYASDDEYVVFTPDDRVDLPLGRIPCRTTADANAAVDKIIRYETNPIEDPWRVRFTFVADDGPQAPGVNDLFIHTQQAEQVSTLVPGLFEKRKIYLYEYPTVVGPSGRLKPAVNVAIDNAINEGTLVLNYTGHGNPRLWANEHVFVKESDFPLLHNSGKYFFLVAATCDYSNFDQLNVQSGGEALTTMPDAGAIGVLAATRPVLSLDNSVLNETVYRNLLQVDSVGHVLPQRIGDVMYRTKQQRTSENDRKYILLGDPALLLGYPKFLASIDSVNHVPATLGTQLKALEHAEIAASVRDTATGQIVNTSGTAEVVVYDASHGVLLTDPERGVTFTYLASGSPLFRGAASINTGLINASFIVPKDISYSNGLGRITVYFTNGASDGAGYMGNVLIGGTDTTAASDLTGPSIRLYLDGRGFRSGDVVSASPTIIADLTDSSGINTSASGVGHRIEAWIDDATQSIDLSDYYRSKVNTYKEGTVQYGLGTMGEGTHKLRLRAWDTYNNSSTAQTVFDVVTGVGLKLTNVFNYPNPFSASTAFAFEHNQATPVDAEVKIYTVAGRLIRSLKTLAVPSQFVSIPWDGRDRDGDKLANGVYLYKIIAKTTDGRFTTEALGKLSVIH